MLRITVLGYKKMMAWILSRCMSDSWRGDDDALYSWCM